MITLDDGVTSIDLPGDLEWVDEFEWSAVVAEQEYTLAGALVVDESERQAGRPITLQGDYVWITRATVLALRALDVSEAQFTLTLEDGRTFTVGWNRASGDSPLVAKPVHYQAPVAVDDWYTIVLRLMEI